MSETDPTPHPQSTLKKSSPARSGCGVTALNFLLLLLSATLLFIVATDRKPIDQLSLERWEIALDRLNSLADRIRGREAISKGDPTAVSSATLDQAAAVSEELRLLAEELTHARTTIARLSSSPEELHLHPAQDGDVPLTLATFLKEGRTPEFRETLTSGKLEEFRAELVTLINEMPGMQRDELRVEIRDANWLLEALDISVSASPTTFEDRIGQFASLSLLSEDSPEGIPASLSEELARRTADLATEFGADLDTLVAAFKGSDSAITDETIHRGMILADVLADTLDETRRTLPAWIGEWREWQNKVKPLLSGKDVSAGPNRIMAVNQFLQQGQLLEQELVALGLATPGQLSADLESLRKSLASAEQAAVRSYQLWALSEIQKARLLAGKEAVRAIEEALSLGESNPSTAVKSQNYQELIRDHPTFRAKLLRLAKIESISTNAGLPLREGTVGAISRELNTITGWTGSAELAKCLNRDLIEQRLLRIDEGLLRRPLDALYSEVFQECWSYLEGSPHRIEVAKAAATTEKKGLELPPVP